MASVVLGVAGSVIGGIVGGPMGAQLGYALGSSLGAALDPQKLPTQYGPRLGDNKVTTSTYNNMLPRIYNKMRMGGNMIWSTPIKETANEQTQGGKGGPQQTSVTYTYSQSMAIAICEGPISGIRKIWANGKLIYDSSNSDVNTVLASNQIAENITFYNGSEEQMPDATIQSYATNELTSAYRGTAYVVFTDFQLAEWGNRTPNFEFEAVDNGDVDYALNELFNIPLTFGSSAFPGFRSFTHVAMPKLDTQRQICWITGFVTESDINSYNMSIAAYDVFSNNTYKISSKIINLPVDIINGVEKKFYDMSTCSGSKSTDGSIIVAARTFDFKQRYYCLFPDSSFINLDGFCTTGNINSFNYESNSYFISAKNDKHLVMSCELVGDKSFSILECSGTSFKNAIRVPLDEYLKRIEVTDSYIFTLTVTDKINKYDLSGNFIENIFTPSGSQDIYTITSGDNDSLYALYKIGSTLNNYQIVDFSDGFLNSITTLPDGAISDTNGFFNQKSLFFFCIASPTQELRSQMLSQTISDKPLTLDKVVSDIVIQSGLTTQDIEVNTLANETVDGYLIGSRMTCRGALEPLMQAYFFDCIESDGKLKFIKRGKQPNITILEDDLSASVYGSQLPDPMNKDRKDSLDLPNEVTVGYSDVNASYQINSQYSRRLIVNTVNTTTISLPMALNNNKAKQISDILLYTFWQERSIISIKLSNKYLYLDPTDVIKLVVNNLTYIVRLTDCDYQNGILSYTAVEEDPSVYIQNSIGSSQPVPQAVIPLSPPTNLILLDLPILRDQDDNVGYYLAASGYTTGWKGCQVYKSIDNGASFTPFGNIITKEATMGNAITSLKSFTSGNIFDELNTVTVVTNKPLVSVSEIAVLNGANLAVLGGEIIQFKNATLVGPNRYTLRGLLRGKFGSSREMGNHATGETFVILNPETIYLENSSSSEYGLEREYNGVTFNTLLNSSNTISFTNNAVAQKPYDPVHVSGGRDSLGNAVLKWVRRTRVNGSWNNFTDVSLGESSELYSVDILKNDGTVARTIDGLITPTAVYTSAQQITDFGSLQTTINYNVYQISSIIGRGYPGVGKF